MDGWTDGRIDIGLKSSSGTAITNTNHRPSIKFIHFELYTKPNKGVGVITTEFINLNLSTRGQSGPAPH